MARRSRRRTYPSSDHADRAPDLIVGYAKGTRVSDESALGAVPSGVIIDNTSEWSGDHCMDPDAVPGILLTNRRLQRPAAALEQLEEFIAHVLEKQIAHLEDAATEDEIKKRLKGLGGLS